MAILEVENVNLTYTRPGTVMRLGRVVYLLVSVGQAAKWQATKNYFRESKKRSVSLDLGELENESVADYVREHFK